MTGCPRLGQEGSAVMITIEVEHTEPPVGRVNSELGQRAFQGWLELLRLLSEAIDAVAPPTVLSQAQPDEKE